MKNLILIPLLFIALIPVSMAVSSDFPGYGILPKGETGALRLLEENPEYDGRNVVVAIFDTGVDPGAPGLQTTTDGNPKIIDMVDGSGSGDVDTSVVQEAADGKLKGLTGRELNINPDWSNPSGKYHLGMKPAFEIFPGGLVRRLKNKRAETWNEKQRELTTRLKRLIAEWDSSHPDASDKEKKAKADLETRLKQLEELQKNHQDPGPIFDCVLFHDGAVWRAVIDRDEDGDLADEPAMTNFKTEREFATFGDEDLLNFAVNIYDEGNLLSIVTDAGSHGTHVAGIVAAHFPDQPDQNGVAPGAQIVSVKIGDSRLGSNSTGTGEIRGCIAAIENDCDLINMSYGGASPLQNRGRLVEIYSEIVNKHGIIWVASAGNEGPALSSAGSPGATTGAILGIGAYVSPDMMEIQYGLRERLSATQYTWSSRGPALDGDLGVDLSAPGGAIAPVPNWTLSASQMMNGTSMASPNACGNIALLLSAMKAEEIPISPHRVRRALENTAKRVSGIEPFALGKGLIQIDKALDYVRDKTEYQDLDLRYEVTVSDDTTPRGVYLREPFETNRIHEYQVRVRPVFHEDADNRLKIAYKSRLELRPTADWIDCAGFLLLNHGGNRFDIVVDPTDLPVGAHYEEIQAYDTSAPDRGPIFRVPVTVIRTEPLSDPDQQAWKKSIRFEPGSIERIFLDIPEGATWGDLHLRRMDNEDGSRLIVLHAVHLIPGHSHEFSAAREYIRMKPGEEQLRSFPVTGGMTLECCLAQFWSSLGDTEVEAELTFHGIRPSSDILALDGTEPLGGSVVVEATLRDEVLRPDASLGQWHQNLMPESAEITPLNDQRDQLPEGRQIYQMVLTYPFEMKAKGKVKPASALTETEGADDMFSSMLFMIFDESKRLITAGYSGERDVSLDKGKYILKFHIRHDNPDVLEKFKDLPMTLVHDISGIGLKIYDNPYSLYADRGTAGSKSMVRGEKETLFVTAPPADRLPDGAQPGDLLSGTITYGGNPSNLAGAGKRPKGFQIFAMAPEKPASNDKEDGDKADKKKDEKEKSEQIRESLRDWKVSQLSKLYAPEDQDLFDQMAQDILSEFPDYLPVLMEQLRRADAKDREENLCRVVKAADRVLAEIDANEVAAFFGVDHPEDTEDEDFLERKKEITRQKEYLIEAFQRKARALFDTKCCGGCKEKCEKKDEGKCEKSPFEQTLTELKKWSDVTGDKTIDLYIDYLIREGRLGEALELINKQIDEKPHKKDLYEQRIKILEKLEWTEWVGYETKQNMLRFPDEFPPF